MPQLSSAPQESPAPTGENPSPSANSAVEESPEFSQLQERYLRTTNALASAAHDPKTPLSILNGYVEMLQSEKLGSLNERLHIGKLGEVAGGDGDITAAGLERSRYFLQ